MLRDSKTGTYTQSDGRFILKNIEPGRYTVLVSSVGYESRVLNVVLTSGKELDLTIELEEKYSEADEVVVIAEKGVNNGINESAVVSTTEFSIDDVRRFAGSREDPARMAQNFAGVLGANDTRNDIIIRGGSPVELLWRLDGLDIPNPNHFATQGATGGPVSALNTNILDNSDFLTGAFPSDYYDRMSGVFDLRTRKGNRDRYEFTGQFGFGGFELGTEGPITGKGSFIANYRYSFLGLLKAMGIDFGFAGIPNYQDATFKIDWLFYDKHKLSVTGLFGTSDITILESEQDSVYTGDTDKKNGTDLLSVGLNYKYLASENLYINIIIGTSYAKYRTRLDSLTTTIDNKVLSKDVWFTNDNLEGFTTSRITVNFKPSRNSFVTVGAEAKLKYFDINEKRHTYDSETGEKFQVVMDGNTEQYIGFANWNAKLNEELTLNIGAVTQYLDISKKITFEPRIALSWNFLEGHNLSLGLGVHSQSLPLLVYYNKKGNEGLEFMKSVHYIAGYTILPDDKSKIKIECYYKALSQIPVERISSAYSLLNSGVNFGAVYSPDSLASKGTGRTYGAELSYTRNFSNGYYITATGSYVRQQYKGSENIWRWGAFDNIYIFNLLGGYEWNVSDDMVLCFSGKYTIAGGAPYTPIDPVKSEALQGTYYAEREAFSLRKPDYSRLDMKLELRQNFNKLSIISYISIENVLDNKNVLSYKWDLQNKKPETLYQLGIFPVGGFRIEF